MKRYALFLLDGRHLIREYDTNEISPELIVDDLVGDAGILGDFATLSEAEGAKQADIQRTETRWV